MDVRMPDGVVIQNVPDDITKEELSSRYQSMSTPQDPALRKAILGARGFNDSIAETMGAIPDLVSKGMGAVGLGGLAPQQGFYTDKLKSLVSSLGGPGQSDATTPGDKLAYGGGRGLGDAASVFMPAAAVANTAKAGSLTANVAKTLAAQPGANAASGIVGGGVGEATNNPLLGLTASLAAPGAMALGSRAITPVRAGLGAEGDRLASLAEREGLNLTPGQKTGSKRLQTFESVLEELPFSGPKQQAINEGNREAFNASVLKRAGVNADKASPEVIDQAFSDLGNKFTKLAEKTTVNLDDDFLTKLQDVSMKYGNKLESQQKPIVESYISDLLDLGDKVPGAKYQSIRSDISRQASGTSDPQFKSALNGIRDALDSAADRSMPIELKGQWRDVRRQYSSLKSVSKAMASAGNGATEGNIPPAQLASAVRQGMGADQYSRGAGDLNDLARIGKQFIQQKTPNSGTAQRSYIQNLLTGGGGFGTFALTRDPVLALGGAAAGAAAPAVASKVYNSRPMSAYLTNNLVRGPKVSKELLGIIAAEQQKQQALGLLD